MNERLRVALLTLEWPSPQHHTGGVGHYAHRLATELANLVDVTVITLAGGENLPDVKAVELPRSSSRLVRYYVTPMRLRRLVRDLDVDIIHAFGDDWALPSSGVPVVRTFHGSSLREARSSSGLRRYNHYVLALLEHLSARRAEVRLAVGVDSEKEFSAHYLVPPVVALRGRPRTPKSATPNVVFVGSFAGRKRGWLAERLSHEAAQALGQPVQLVAIAPESDRNLWGPHTTVVSGADDDEVMRRIAHAWLLVAPSTYEGFGLPAFEALSAGVRVVATANPGAEYLRSVVADPLLFATCDLDDELLPAVLRALEAGPRLSETEQAAGAAAVTELVRRGSPEFLRDTVYPLALRG